MSEESHTRRLSRIKWLCRRGMKELDVLLERFCRQELANLQTSELTDFEALLNLEDPDLYEVLIGSAPMSDPGCNALASRINGFRRVT